MKHIKKFEKIEKSKYIRQDEWLDKDDDYFQNHEINLYKGDCVLCIHSNTDLFDYGKKYKITNITPTKHTIVINDKTGHSAIFGYRSEENVFRKSKGNEIFTTDDSLENYLTRIESEKYNL